MKHFLDVADYSPTEIQDILDLAIRLKKEYFAERPECERLVNRKLKLRDMDTMRDWKIALKEYLESAYSDYL